MHSNIADDRSLELPDGREREVIALRCDALQAQSRCTEVSPDSGRLGDRFSPGLDLMHIKFVLH